MHPPAGAAAGRAAHPTPYLCGMNLVFGPVASRRLGRSLGIANVPPKTCSYSCAYCHVGATVVRDIERRDFHPPAAIARAVGARLDALRERGDAVDFLTFAPDGEPTLDRNLGASLEAIRRPETRVAVFTNASLLWRADVQDELRRADCVSVKVDAVNPDVWRRLNRPHRTLRLEAVLDGIETFARGYEGKLLTETMLLAGVNDDDEHLDQVAEFLAVVAPAVAYVAVPAPRTAASWAVPADDLALARAARRLGHVLPRVDRLVGRGEGIAPSR